MLKKLKVTHKIVLMLCAVAVPLLGATLFATIKGFNKDINFALQEKRGNAFQRPLAHLLDLLPQHQWLASAVARGDVAAKGAMLEKQVVIDQVFADLETANSEHGEALEFTDAGLAKYKRQGMDPRSVKGQWQKLKQTTLTLAASDVAKEHQTLITAVRSMIDHGGDTSNLILDPDLDSYYMMDVTLLALPQTQDRLGAIASYGNDVLRRDRASVTPKDLEQFGVFAALLQEGDMNRINGDVDKALNYDAGFHGLSASLQKGLAGPLQGYQTACSEFLSQLEKAQGPAGSVTPEAFVTAGQQARTAAYKLWEASVAELDLLLDKRLSAMRQTRMLTLAWVAGALVLSGLLAWWVSRSLTRPLAGLAQATQRIVRGDTNVRAPVFAQDEIGALAESFNTMLNTRNKAQATMEAESKRLQSNIQELLVVVSDASDGKLGVRAKVSEGVLGNVCDALNLMLENVGGIIANAKSASAQVATASTGISSVAQELEKGEQRQTQEILTTSEGVRDLNGKAQQVLENCQAATQAAANGRKAAEQGAKAVREVIQGMEKIRENTQANAKKIKRLGDRSMEISGIVKVIGDISAKTDMLALNASIEAARAGEQGRGFTVVAEQVRSLADRTKTLTNQIEKLVNDIQKETGEAVAQMETQTQEVEAGARAAQSAGGTLENIVNVSTESSNLVAKINQSASQQAERTQAMMATVETINQAVAEASVKVRETKETSEQLMTLSSELNKRLAQFEVMDNSAVYESAAA